MEWKEDIQTVLKRIEAFWEKEILDYPCVSVKAPKKRGVNISPFRNETDYHGDLDALKRYWTDPVTIYNDRINKLSGTYFGGESLPSIFQNYGTSGHCNYYGAVPTYGQDTIWFDPIMDEVDPDKLIFRQDVLDRHLNIARYLVEHSEGKYFVAQPDSTGSLDALCHLCGSETVLMALYEDPEAVKKAVSILNKGWKRSHEQFYQITKENCNGSVHAWMDLWAPGLLQHMQCDLSVMLSPEMYKIFVMPELEEQSQWLDYAVYHFDGVEQARHLDYILSLEKLRAVQWTYVAGQPSPSHYVDILKRIQNSGKGLIIMAEPSDLPVLMEELSAKGLYIHCDAADESEARDIVKYVRTHFHD